jgi:hypothetical protein
MAVSRQDSRMEACVALARTGARGAGTSTTPASARTRGHERRWGAWISCPAGQPAPQMMVATRRAPTHRLLRPGRRLRAPRPIQVVGQATTLAVLPPAVAKVARPVAQEAVVVLQAGREVATLEVVETTPEVATTEAVEAIADAAEKGPEVMAVVVLRVVQEVVTMAEDMEDTGVEATAEEVAKEVPVAAMGAVMAEMPVVEVMAEDMEVADAAKEVAAIASS